MSSKILSDIAAFNHKAEVLLGSSFMRIVRSEPSGTSFHWQVDRGSLDILHGPDGESVQAALYTLRMFIQDNDRISIRNIGLLYEKEPKLAGLLPEYKEIQNNLNANLDTGTNVSIFDKIYTFREALYVFLYATGHTDESYIDELDEILKAPIVGNLFKNFVNVAITTIALYIELIVPINHKAVERLG